jgi:hypothetical protein
MQQSQSDMVLVPISLLLSLSDRLNNLAQELELMRLRSVPMPSDVEEMLIRDFAFALNWSIPTSKDVGRIYGNEQGRT